MVRFGDRAIFRLFLREMEKRDDAAAVKTLGDLAREQLAKMAEPEPGDRGELREGADSMGEVVPAGL